MKQKMIIISQLVTITGWGLLWYFAGWQLCIAVFLIWLGRGLSESIDDYLEEYGD